MQTGQFGMPFHIRDRRAFSRADLGRTGMEYQAVYISRSESTGK